MPRVIHAASRASLPPPPAPPPPPALGAAPSPALPPAAPLPPPAAAADPADFDFDLPQEEPPPHPLAAQPDAPTNAVNDGATDVMSVAPPPSPASSDGEASDHCEHDAEEGPLDVTTLCLDCPGHLTVDKVVMPDRREEDAPEEEWLFQWDVERVLYGSEKIHDPKNRRIKHHVRNNGSVCRLLQRTPGAQDRALQLSSRQSIAQGLVTTAEWEQLCGCIHTCARKLTLIPVDVVAAAARQYGPSPESAALLRALDYMVPLGWSSSSSSGNSGDGTPKDDDGDDEDEDGDSSSRTDCGSGSGGGGDDDGGGDASTEEEDEDSGTEKASSSTGSAEGGESEAPSSPTAVVPVTTSHAAKRSRTSVTSCAVLERELGTYRNYRLVELNKHRSSGAVRATTVDNDTTTVKRFLQWVEATKGVEIQGLVAVFRSAQLADLVQSYVEHLTKTKGRKFSTVAAYVTGLLNVTRFVLALCRARSLTPVNEAPLHQLVALQKQCLKRARADGRFDACTAAKTNWLDWDDVQRARLASVWAYRAACRDEEDDSEEKLARARDALLMALLTLQPPDRVGIARNLQLGVTLKCGQSVRGVTEYVLDLSAPDAHKTSSVFGPSRTTISAQVAKWIDIYLELAGDGMRASRTPYLFHQPGDCNEALSPVQWTRLVKACFMRHSGVPLAPKDLRASFITFLKSEDHDDETLKAAALAMKHSSKTQASAAYTKDQSDRLVAAAVRVAEGYAAKFG